MTRTQLDLEPRSAQCVLTRKSVLWHAPGSVFCVQEIARPSLSPLRTTLEVLSSLSCGVVDSEVPKRNARPSEAEPALAKLQLEISTEPHEDNPLHPFRRWHALLFSLFGLCLQAPARRRSRCTQPFRPFRGSCLCRKVALTHQPPAKTCCNHLREVFVPTLCVIHPCAARAETSALVVMAAGRAIVRLVPHSFLLASTELFVLAPQRVSRWTAGHVVMCVA